MQSSIARAKGVRCRRVDDGKIVVAVKKSSDDSFPLGLGRRRKQAGVASVQRCSSPSKVTWLTAANCHVMTGLMPMPMRCGVIQVMSIMVMAASQSHGTMRNDFSFSYLAKSRCVTPMEAAQEVKSRDAWQSWSMGLYC